MNVNKAREITQNIVELKAVAAAFASTYGSDYRLTEDSSKHALELYRRGMDLQAAIASLLHPEALSGAYSRYGHWWERGDMIPSVLVNEMAHVVFELVGRYAYSQGATESGADSYNTLVLEQCLAGMLHPSALISALESSDAVLESVP